ncbi:hypothetical protein E3N88_23084 [Mikania micrantha]|uniref:Uncharacterized protein n=1 Tax=Mikania micrantha TaxID=192012 RepID=A0A5N6M4L2_9ASTR|nr:hypothetical protein E3N88_36739 [Mikania micrantha]KAD3336735.1 hypothetical protein E3N88_32254 [Mikania micrantha]KAD4585483.1 hypothetical protein E3N88_23084 [Mikania micrantha]
MTRAWEGPRWLQGLVSAATKEEPYGCCSRSGSYTHVRQGKFLIEKYPPHSVCFNPFLICSLVEKPEKAAIHSVTTGSNGAPGIPTVEKPAASVKAAQIVMFWW